MKTVAVNGYKSYIGKNFHKYYKKKYKIIYYKDDINNLSKFKLFTKKNKFDFFIHLAGLSRLKCDINKKLCEKTNYSSFKKIINHFNRFHKKPRVIFVSSSHVYQISKNKLTENSVTKPSTLYGKLKLKSEIFLKANYKNYCILRLFNVYGRKQPQNFFIPDIIKKIKKKEKIEINKSIRDFIHIDDVLKVIDFVINNDIKDTLNVGSSRGVSLEYIVKKISKKLNNKPLLNITNKSDKLIASIKRLRKFGYKKKINEKFFNI